MNKELIELQIGCNATCVVVLEEDYKYLEPVLVMDASLSDEYLFAVPTKNPIFREKLDSLSKEYSIVYFMIRRIDELSEEDQNRYISLVKDREFQGYNIPCNVIIIFTVNDRESLKKISRELYHFCVVAF